MQAQGYFYREVYSLCYVLMGLWPLSHGFNFIRSNSGLLATWTAACFSMASFTFLPVVKVESVNLMQVSISFTYISSSIADSDLSLLGGSIMCLIGLFYLAFGDYLLRRSEVAKASMEDDTRAGFARIILGVQVSFFV